MNNIFDNDDLGDDPFPPTTTPAPKKRGRPAGTPVAAKSKPKVAKPKYIIQPHRKTELVTALMGVANVLAPYAASYGDKMRIAADVLDMIEKAKA
jgi:hypothetical protein